MSLKKPRHIGFHRAASVLLNDSTSKDLFRNELEKAVSFSPLRSASPPKKVSAPKLGGQLGHIGDYLRASET